LIFRHILEIDPRNADAFFNLGALSEQRHDLVSALGFYRDALNLRPDDTELQTAVASIQAQFARNKSNTNPLIGGADYNQTHNNRAHSSLAEQPQFARQQPIIGFRVQQFLV